MTHDIAAKDCFEVNVFLL